MDNCSQNLHEIEAQYKDHNIKLNIRQNEFQAPEYLVEKIKKMINRMIFEIFTLTFDRIETKTSSQSLTAKEQAHLEYEILMNNCRIEKMEFISKRKSYSIPKAVAISKPSKHITEQSKILSSSEFAFQKMSILNASIEIHVRPDPLTDLEVSISYLVSHSSYLIRLF